MVPLESYTAVLLILIAVAGTATTFLLRVDDPDPLVAGEASLEGKYTTKAHVSIVGLRRALVSARYRFKTFEFLGISLNMVIGRRNLLIGELSFGV